jgi:apolipoprotein N-acyltransferase
MLAHDALSASEVARDKKLLHSFYIRFALLILSVCLFYIAHPNFIIHNGVPAAAWIAFVPVFLLVDLTSFKTVWLYGFLYGAASYVMYCSWMVSFSPVAITAACICYGVMLAVVFLLLKSAAVIFPRRGWILQWLIFVSYEYVKTLGFFGFSYGVIGYTQWKFLSLVKCASVTGVWGISAIVVFCSALVSDVIRDADYRFAKQKIADSLRLHCSAISVFIFLFALCVTFGVLSSRSEKSTDPSCVESSVHIALIQNNSDPWKNGIESYKNDIFLLESLTDEALAEHPETQIIVWPETAVVPSVMWNYYQREDRSRYELIEQLLSYMEKTERIFVIGNDHTVQKEFSQDGTAEKEDFNSVLVFEKGAYMPPSPRMYSKMHLVPLTEYFPWQKQFSRFYKFLLNGDTHLWSPGKTTVVFKITTEENPADDKSQIRFATPVCFEDTFPSISRAMCRAGAELLVNLSNDAWSESAACQYQHLSMAVFRAAENNVPEVRSTASGITCVIDKNGRVVKEAPFFEPSYICADVSVVTGCGSQTVYKKYGDFFAVAELAAAAIFFLYGIVMMYLKRRGQQKILWKKNNK